jgi:flagellar biogenesis protein FliO
MMTARAEGRRNAVPGRITRRCMGALLGVGMLFLLAGLLSQRAGQAQEMAGRGTAMATLASGQPGGAPATDDGTMDPEARPLPAYRAPRREPPPAEVPANLLFDIAGKLALVVLVIFACAAGWKMVQVAVPQGLAQSNPSLQVTSTVTLGPQRCLHLVTVGQQRLLLASSPQQINMLGTVSPESGFATVQEVAIPALPPSSLAAQPEPSDRFEHLLTRLTDALAPQTEPAPPSEAPARRGFFEVAPDGTVVEKRAAEMPFTRSEDADEDDWSTGAMTHNSRRSTLDGDGPLSEPIVDRQASSVIPSPGSGAPARGTLVRVAAGSADA